MILIKIWLFYPDSTTHTLGVATREGFSPEIYIVFHAGFVSSFLAILRVFLEKKWIMGWEWKILLFYQSILHFSKLICPKNDLFLEHFAAIWAFLGSFFGSIILLKNAQKKPLIFFFFFIFQKWHSKIAHIPAKWPKKYVKKRHFEVKTPPKLDF